MNPARHLFIERNIDGAEQPDHYQAGLAETLPQTQPDVSELHRHDLPCQRHPEGRPPDHWTATNGIIKRAGVIDQPRVSGKLRESDYNFEEKKSREQCVAPNDCKPNEQTIIDNIKSGACAPVRPRRERQQLNRDHVDDNRRDHHAQTTTLKRRVVRIRKRHDAALASHAITVNHVGFVLGAYVRRHSN